MADFDKDSESFVKCINLKLFERRYQSALMYAYMGSVDYTFLVHPPYIMVG